MDSRYAIIETNQVFVVTNLKTGKWFRVLSNEMMSERMSEWPPEEYRIGIMNSNSGLGGFRTDGKPVPENNRTPLSSENPWSYHNPKNGAPL